MNQQADYQRRADGADPDPRNLGSWRADLTERMRVLLHAKPLFDMRRSDALRASELRHYDTLTLAVKVWDLIVENIGLDSEINRNSVVSALEPLLVGMDAAVGVEPDAGRHRTVVEQVLASMANDSESRRPFNVVYQDFDGDGQAVSRMLEFRLVWDYLHPSGDTVLRLSSEAINLYLRAWDLDIEDAQAAAEAVVLSQLQRGKFDEAVQSARNARLQSLRYWEKIIRVIRDTRRDVHRVDWRHEAPGLLNEALKHVKTRTGVEGSILQTARERLDILDVGDDGSRAVAEVCRLVEDCRKRHFELHGQLMDARNVFLDEQDRQAFQPQACTHLPSMTDEVLLPLLGMPRAKALSVIEEAAAPLNGALPPPLLSLAHLVNWMLQPRRATGLEEAPFEAPELVDYDEELLRFTDEVRERGDAMLQDIAAPTTLSELLTAVSDWDGAPEIQEYLVLSTLRRYAPEKEDPRRLDVRKLDGARLQAEGFIGDELILDFAGGGHE